MALSNESPAVAFFGISIACLIISQTLAYLTSLEDEWPGEISTCALLCIGLQWLMFIPSAFLLTEKFFDMTGTASYFVLAVFSLVRGKTFHLRQLVVTLFVLVWSVRLGAFLYLRVQRAGKDGRFDEIKHNLPRFFNMWTIQGLWVFLTELPLFCLNSIQHDVEFPQWTDYTGMVCAAIGFAFEVIADNQKTEFQANPENEGKWIQTGLWQFSRHPNYFGEILFWIGICLISTTVFSGTQWMCVESPVFVAFLLIKVSGIPLLEKRADMKWGDQAEYQAYKEQTPVLVPLPASVNDLMTLLSSFMPGPISEPRRSGPTSELSESLMNDEGAQQPVVEKVEEMKPLE